jgi:hypothetical protein
LIGLKSAQTLGLTMSLYFDPERFGGIEQLQEIVLVHRGSQHGITVHCVTKSCTISHIQQSEGYEDKEFHSLPGVNEVKLTWPFSTID